MEQQSFNVDTITQEHEERKKKMNSIEEEGIKNILKHFDRIHDNLFNFNNLLIGGYFALGQIDKSVPVKTIIVPIINLTILLLIEYRMMEKSRLESKITRLKPTEIDNFDRSINSTNKYSLLTITSTLVVTGIFLYYLMG